MAVVSKVLAIALLLVLAGNTALPAFFADSQSTLPTCCRRDGKHHCEMVDMAGQHNHDGPAWTQSRCAQFPKTSAASYSAQPVPAPSTLATALVFSRQSIKAQTEALYRVSHSRTRQKRGPPSLL
jgi:hypothetical protein